jgi:D-alanyl-D-alanine carboxypeptidase (penicillin-binding protein 5/6)
LLDKPAPHVSAASWVVLDVNSKDVLFGKLEKERREVASLTKILTFYTVLQLCDLLRLDMTKELVTVDESVQDVIGTTAMLVPGDIFTVE